MKRLTLIAALMAAGLFGCGDTGETYPPSNTPGETQPPEPTVPETVPQSEPEAEPEPRSP